MALPSAPLANPLTPQPAGKPSAALIGGTYAVDTTRLLPGAAGGLPAFVATDRRGADLPLMAVQVRPHAPARAAALQMLLANPVEGILAPIAHGPARGPGGEIAWFIICPAPSGPPLWSAPQGNGAATQSRPWSEPELLECLLRPVAHALERLHIQLVTHRSIRLDNLFRAGPREAVVLGHAWAAPPASMQPALYEPPYSAMCIPAGRGDGTIADDVYALGVVFLTLALGHLPCAGLDDAAIIRRKLELGSFAALVGDERLPPAIADIARGMLAEDPEHRPPPSLLTDPVAARARRVAARPPRRGQRPLEVGLQTAWNARTLAYALACDPEQAARLVRSGAVDAWLRRGLGEPTLAARLEETLHLRGAEGTPEDQRTDSTLVMRAVAVLDPLAPLCWRNIALWPNGIGPALAELTAATPPTAPGPDRAEVLQQVIATDAIGSWGTARPERCDFMALRADSNQFRNLLRLGGWSGGLSRLRYALNPLMPCCSRLLQGKGVVRLSDLLPALEAAAAVPDFRKEPPIDYEIAAFLATRNDHHIESELGSLADTGHPERAALMQLRLLAMLQLRLQSRKLPGLAAWLADQAKPALAIWRNRQRRERIEQALNELTGAGQLTALLGVLEDPQTLATDSREFNEAALAVQAIDAELARIASNAGPRAATARRIAHDTALGLGATALAIAAVVAVPLVMAAKAKAPRAATRPGSFLWLQGLVCGAIATLATPTFILGALLLAPAMVAMLTDRSRGKTTARSVMLFGLAGTVQPLADLWHAGHTIANALDMASDTTTLATAWAAQAGAWLLCELGPLLIALVMDGMSGAKVARLRAARAAYEDQWGLSPTSHDGSER